MEVDLSYVFKNPHLFTVGDLKKMIKKREELEGETIQAYKEYMGNE